MDQISTKLSSTFRWEVYYDKSLAPPFISRSGFLTSDICIKDLNYSLSILIPKYGSFRLVKVLEGDQVIFINDDRDKYPVRNS